MRQFTPSTSASSSGNNSRKHNRSWPEFPAHGSGARLLCKCRSKSVQRSDTKAQDVVAVVELASSVDATVAPSPTSSAVAQSTSGARSDTSQALKFKALLAIILKLLEQDQTQQQQSYVQQAPIQHDRQQQQQQQQAPVQHDDNQQQQQQSSYPRLEAFLRAQPVTTCIPFISWLADLEAAATGAMKAQLCQLCELLVLQREAQDREGQEALYADTLRLLSGGDEQAVALMSAEPRQYALALAEGMSNQPLVLQGYGPAYDALLQVAPPAAVTPAAVAQGHALAEELGADLSSRRKSTVAAMLGRVQLDSLSPEQQAALLEPSPAARILDLLLSLPSSSDRLALLPDCFTPPAPDAEAEGQTAPAAAAAEAVPAAAAGEGSPADEADGDTDELWCTPMQLLNEIDRRLSAGAAAAAEAMQPGSNGGNVALPATTSSSSSRSNNSSGGTAAAQSTALPFPSDAAGGGGMTAEELLAALQQLRHHIQEQWLESLPHAG